MLNEIDLSRTDLNLLVLFETVLAERHVGRSAQRLNLSPSAVSHGLGRLRRLLNDPLFLRTPRGVVPTDRALALAQPVAAILHQVRGVLSSADAFDASRSRRRFIIGAPDGIAAVLLPGLLQRIGRVAPGIDIAIRHLLPAPGVTSPDAAWQDAIATLEARGIDVAILPHDRFPARLATRALYREDFVIALRAGHPWLKRQGLEAWCELHHLVVSQTGDPTGFVDEALARRGLARRIALTAPNFMFALATLARTDLAAALPRRLVSAHGSRFGIAAREPPLKLRRFPISLVLPRAALDDAGLAWLCDQIEAAAQTISAKPPAALPARAR